MLQHVILITSYKAHTVGLIVLVGYLERFHNYSIVTMIRIKRRKLHKFVYTL